MSGDAADDDDLDIVERALAILDEESRSWLTGERTSAEPAEGSSDAR